MGSSARDSDDLTRRAVQLLCRGRRQSTKKSYCSKWQRFVHFCSSTLPAVYGKKPRCFLPAHPRTVLLYIAHLSQEGLVAETSLNPYMAAINQAHEDTGLMRPALGHHFRLARAGWRDIEGAERDELGDRVVRTPVPPDVMLSILFLGLRTDDVETLRRCACLILCYSWYNHADSGVLLLRRHVTIDARGVTINSQGKTVARNAACPIHRPRAARFDNHGLVLKLLERWHTVSERWQSPDDVYWSLETDAHTWRASIIDQWLRGILSSVGHTAPAGEIWSGHSLRSGGASASLAIGVDMFRIMKHGVWKTLAAIERYLSLHVLPSAAAYIFFGWMLPPRFDG